MGLFRQFSGWALLALVPVVWYSVRESGVGYGAALNVIILAVCLYWMTGSSGEAA